MNLNLSIMSLEPFVGLGSTFLLCLCMLGYAVTFAVRARPHQLPILVAFGILTSAFGGLGALVMMHRTIDLTAVVPPEERAEFLVSGAIDAGNLLTVVALFVVLSSVAAFVGVVRVSRRPGRVSTSHPPADMELSPALTVD